MTDIPPAVSVRLGTVFSQATAIYGRRFVQFVVLTVIAHIPQYIVMTVAPEVVAGTVVTAAAAGGIAISILTGMVTSTLAGGVVMYGVVQELRGQAFSLKDALGVVLRRALPMLGVAFCVAIAAVLALIVAFIPGTLAVAVFTVLARPASAVAAIAGVTLGVIPGLIVLGMVFCMFWVAVPACIVERTGVFASMSRSRFLTRGDRWRVFGVMVVLAVVSMALIMAARLLLPSVALVSQLAIGAVLGAFGGVVNGVFYYDLRVAKEGVDIDKLASVFD